MRRHITLAVAALLAVSSLSAFAAEVKLSGYVQERYTDTIGAPDTNSVSGFNNFGTFNIRRARLAVKATLDAQSQATVEIDASKYGVETKKAFVSYSIPEVYVSVGRNAIPFGYELQQSASAIVPLDRAMISLKLPEYTTGLSLTPGSNILPFKTTLSVVNGDDPAALGTVKVTGTPVAAQTDNAGNSSFNDVNDNKIVILTTEIPVPVLESTKFGASYLTNGQGKSAVGAALVNSYDKFGFQAEYIVTDFSTVLAPSTTRCRGYYAMATYAVSPLTTGYARYDTLNDQNAAGKKNRTTVGAAIMLGENTKWTVEYQAINDPANKPLNGAFGTQMQMKF